MKHKCPFLELTQEFNGKISYGYCNRMYDVLTIPGKITDEHINLAREGFPNVDDWKISNIQDRISYIQMDCLCESIYETSITGLIHREAGLIKYPISYEDGWEYYSIIAFDKNVSANILNKLDKIDEDGTVIEILSNNDLGIEGLFETQLLSVPELFRDLTLHQLNTLIDAIEKGYYEIPRTVRTKDIAEDKEVSRYAIDKVIRAAENKIIKGLTPYLYFKQYLEQSKRD